MNQREAGQKYGTIVFIDKGVAEKALIG